MSKQTIQARQSEVTFIKESDVKLLTPLSANKVTTSIINFILLAQDMQIKKILGATLYRKLMAEWIQSNMNVNALPDGTGVIPPIIPLDEINYKELYEMIYKPLVWWSYLTALPNIAIKVEESGVMINSTSYSESAGMVGLDRLINEGSMIARQYTEYLNEYICKTFSDDVDVQTESVESGGVSLNIYTSRKPWHNVKGCCGR